MTEDDINKAVAKVTHIINAANISIPKSSGYSKKNMPNLGETKTANRQKRTSRKHEDFSVVTQQPITM